jgi:hypothetical protein
MRRRVGGFIAVSGLVLAGVMPSVPAAAEPSTGATPAVSYIPGTAVCKVGDTKIVNVSGIAATANGFVVVNDGKTERAREKIYFLDGACKVLNSFAYPVQARDPQDVSVAKDGTVWVADIGDNASGGGTRRTTIAVWTLAPSAKEPVIHRFAYPDGKPKDAQAMLLAPNGTPVFVTRDPIGEVYVPAGPLQNNNTTGVQLKKLGSFAPQKTGTPNQLSFIGATTITGGAVSPDGTKAVIRTLSDAYEFDVANGDVGAAVISGKFRVTPLPNEPQGEGITYTTDGKAYVTCTDSNGAITVFKYNPIAVKPAGNSGAQAPSPKAKEGSFLKNLTLNDLTYAVAAIGVLGLVLVVGGILGIRKSRAQRRAEAAANKKKRPRPDDGDPFSFDSPDGPDQGGGTGTVYGGAPRPGPPASAPSSGAGRGGGTVYGGAAPPKAAPPQSGGVYGGSGSQSGAVYGGGQQQRGQQYGSPRGDYDNPRR